MKVELTRLNQAYHFQASDNEGRIIDLDASPSIGGEGKGVRPMELLLMAIGGCSSIDVGLILKKQKQDLKDYKVSISGSRYDDHGKALKELTLDFELTGDLSSEKVERALELTITKYCSVILSLHPDIQVNYTYQIKNAS